MRWTSSPDCAQVIQGETISYPCLRSATWSSSQKVCLCRLCCRWSWECFCVSDGHKPGASWGNCFTVFFPLSVVEHSVWRCVSLLLSSAWVTMCTKHPALHDNQNIIVNSKIDWNLENRTSPNLCGTYTCNKRDAGACSACWNMLQAVESVRGGNKLL